MTSDDQQAQAKDSGKQTTNFSVTRPPADGTFTSVNPTPVSVAVTTTLLFVAGMLLLYLNKAPTFYPVDRYTDIASRTAAIASLRTALMAGFVGLVAVGTLVVGVYNARINSQNVAVARAAQQTGQETAQATAEATQKTIEINQKGQITERYTKAVELLGGDTEMATLGGIYALERLAVDSIEYRQTVVQVLSAYLRDQIGLMPDQIAGVTHMPGDDDRNETLSIPNDIEYGVSTKAALTVIGRIGKENEPPNELSGFSRLDWKLRRATAIEIRDGGVGADLRRTNLRNTDLDGADLRGANLRGADLTDARLYGADLRFASAAAADFTRSRMVGANLLGARFSNCYFVDAVLDEASFGPSEIIEETTILERIDLKGASLVGAKLQGVNLSRARGLTQDQIDYAWGDSETRLPSNLTRPLHWPNDPSN